MPVKFLVFISVFVSLSTAQILYKEPCPKTPILKNFNWNWYLGTWFEQERFFTSYQNLGTCWSGTYLKNKKNGNIQVRLDFKSKLLPINEITVDVFAKKPYAAPNKLTYTIPRVPLLEDQYEVLDTDYKNWTIEYSCRNIKVGSLRFAWILTRSPHPSKKVISEAKRRMKQLGIDIYRLERHPNTCIKKY